MSQLSYTRLQKEDYEKNCLEMATYLIGKILVRKLDNGITLKGRIVETECYLGGEDKASHSYAGKHTPRNEAMYMPAGTCYVYQTYGMYYCFNISSIEPGAAVLLRALEPLQGLNIMAQFRSIKNEKQKAHTAKYLSNGPAKLCISLDIKKDNCNKLDLTANENQVLWIEDDPKFDSNKVKLIKSHRIGLGRVDPEWRNALLRFYIFGNPYVSKIDRQAEKEMEVDA